MKINRDDPYQPGEPYEFTAYDTITGGREFLAYRCFRGQCAGRTCMVVDRNTHNQYHNGREHLL